MTTTDQDAMTNAAADAIVQITYRSWVGFPDEAWNTESDERRDGQIRHAHVTGGPNLATMAYVTGANGVEVYIANPRGTDGDYIETVIEMLAFANSITSGAGGTPMAKRIVAVEVAGVDIPVPEDPAADHDLLEARVRIAVMQNLIDYYNECELD